MSIDMAGIPDMPPQMAAMMHREMPEICIGPGMTHPPISPQAQANHCHTVRSRVSGNQITIIEACDVAGHPMRTRSITEVSADGKSFVEHSKILQGFGVGETTTMRGSWVGPTCPNPSQDSGLPAGPLAAPGAG